MYISEIEIQNFRNFSQIKDDKGRVSGTKISFVEGTNIIIGHNNAGKTNLLKALQLIFNARTAKKSLTIDDFCKDYSDFSTPPEINVIIKIKEQKDEPVDDKVVVYDWITDLGDSYEATLTFSFFLPFGDDYNYFCEEIKKYREGEGKYNSDKAWQFLDKYFLPKYVAKVYGGDPDNKDTADSEMLEKFDFQFLDAIRDAERQIFFGSNTILKNVLNFFLDYDITDGKKIKDLSEEARQALKDREDGFRTKSSELLNSLKGRISKDHILQYAKDTGASRGGEPDFDSDVDEEHLLFALRLIVNVGGMDIPISNNGLGYNNLLYISLVLAKMQIESTTSYYGENAKVFPVLLIEEPEAHLHPSMQFKLLTFLNNNINKEGKVRQLFVTTHSTHITSAVALDNIICMYKDVSGTQRVGYPGRSFGSNSDSKNYVKRFLDATKSNMLFADKIIFVEGLAEQILLPCFAAYIKADEANAEDELVSQHTSIISVDSRTFKHFLMMYRYGDTNTSAINKKVVCITDADPTKKCSDNKWRSCFPYELGEGEDYKQISSHVTELQTDFVGKCSNIKVFFPKPGKGKTLEYEIAMENPALDILRTDCFPKQNSPYEAENIQKLYDTYTEKAGDFDTLRNMYLSFLSEEKKAKVEPIIDKLKNSEAGTKEKSHALLATIFLDIVKSLKGIYAFELEQALRKDLKAETPVFKVPEYIEKAIMEVLIQS